MMSWKKKFPVLQALAAVLLIAAFFVVAGILLQHNWQCQDCLTMAKNSPLVLA
jgi:predicted transporter